MVKSDIAIKHLTRNIPNWIHLTHRVRIAKNVLICKPDPTNNKHKIWCNIFRSQKSYFSFFIHLLQGGTAKKNKNTKTKTSSLPICNFKAMLHRICNILSHSPSCLHVITRSISYVRFDWSFIYYFEKCCMKIWHFRFLPCSFLRVLEGKKIVTSTCALFPLCHSN
jgi:hypothetical protein